MYFFISVRNPVVGDHVLAIVRVSVAIIFVYFFIFIFNFFSSSKATFVGAHEFYQFEPLGAVIVALRRFRPMHVRYVCHDTVTVDEAVKNLHCFLLKKTRFSFARVHFEATRSSQS